MRTAPPEGGIDAAIVSEEDVDWATVAVRDLARSIGFEPLDVSMIAAATSELATNMLRHAYGGRLRAAATDNGRGLEASFSDKGPGIVDTALAFTEGYSTRDDSLGLGLAAARRAVERLELSSTPGRGTTVTIRHHLPPPAALFELGLISMADPDYPCNGDVVFERKRGGEAQLLALIDGLGQGAAAREAAVIAREALAGSPAASPAGLLRDAHRAVLEAGVERGFVAAVARADPRGCRVATVGDVHCRLYGPGPDPRRVSLPERPGILGTQRTVSVAEHEVLASELGSPTLLVLATDGVSPRFDEGDFDHDDPAQLIAEDILRARRRRHGDASVAVLRIAP